MVPLFLGNAVSMHISFHLLHFTVPSDRIADSDYRQIAKQVQTKIG